MEDQVAGELRTLRQGLGVRRSNLATEVGPGLRQLLSLSTTADDDAVRAALISALRSAAEMLPPGEAAAFLFGMAIRSDRRTLSERLIVAGDRNDRGERAMRRRMDLAIAAVARHLVHHRHQQRNHPMAPTGWELVSMTSRFDLRGRLPVIDSVKTIVALEPLSSIIEAVSLPQRPEASDVDILVTAGGVRSFSEQLRASVWRYGIDFERTLREGEVHTFQVQISVSRRDAIAPFNVIDGFRRCGSGVCEVQFADDEIPTIVERLDGLPASALYDPLERSNLIESASYLRAEFSNMRSGLTYGLRWG